MIDIGVTNAKTTRIRVKNKRKYSTKSIVFFYLSLLKENKQEEQCAQSKGWLLQLQIQALQMTECSYKNRSYKCIMAKPLK